MQYVRSPPDCGVVEHFHCDVAIHDGSALDVHSSTVAARMWQIQ